MTLILYLKKRELRSSLFKRYRVSLSYDEVVELELCSATTIAAIAAAATATVVPTAAAAPAAAPEAAAVDPAAQRHQKLLKLLS